MSDTSAELLGAICEIRDLVRLLAGPAIAARDQNLRDELRRIVGDSVRKGKAVLLMDGTHTQRAIHREIGIDEGQLSVLVKQLKKSGLLPSDGKELKLAISLPKNFFEKEAADGR